MVQLQQGLSRSFLLISLKKPFIFIIFIPLRFPGRFSPYADQACSDGNFSNGTEWLTLVAHASREVPCPFPGHYLIPTAQPSRYASRCGEMTKVTIGCNRNTVVQFQTHSDTTDCPAAEPGEIIESTSSKNQASHKVEHLSHDFLSALQWSLLATVIGWTKKWATSWPVRDGT